MIERVLLGTLYLTMVGLVAVSVWAAYVLVTLPPLSCHPTHGAVQMNCVHGHLAP